MRRISLAAALVLAGCASVARHEPGKVNLLVHNPSYNAVNVQVCAPVSCTPYVAVAGRASSRFSFVATGGTRAVVTAKKGDRIVARHPIDYQAGDFYRIELDVR